MMKQSLRDMKREATAHALAEAAFQLAIEHGLDGFVVEDVAQLAGYSRRTFANHYSCKEEAVAMAAFPFHGFDEFINLVEKLPESSTPLDVMYQFTKMRLTGGVIRDMRQLVLLSKDYPSLGPYILSALHQFQMAAQRLLNELFQDHYSKEYTHFLAGAMVAAVTPLFNGDIEVLLPGQTQDEAPNAKPFDQYLDKLFGYLRNGFRSNPQETKS
ncbi:TetR/AcrR family transcriptional regulator [Paenibacillus antibioticophila]|uniref:TetR/AcrR family transcriptional regulator n=1 Tax=Paenibacillus antibioticophila TaxID=1274374 RepID=UPI0005CA4208|nr:TetR/AcrR family transcriptional regulator [Paenibacillus antibioticophila]